MDRKHAAMSKPDRARDVKAVQPAGLELTVVVPTFNERENVP